MSPGCLMPQKSIMYKAGTAEYQCTDSSQCDGDAVCQYNAQYNAGTCVCKVWSAREHHAVTVHGEYMYLAGGYTFLRLSNCGAEQTKRPSGEEFACGGQFRGMMNDVWRTKDGANWEMVQEQAPWSPRGELGLVSFQGLLYLFGGRTGNSQNQSTQLLNDIWSTSDGITWNVKTSNAPWSPRAKHQLVVEPIDEETSHLILMYGESEEEFLRDVWEWDGADAWIRDYSNESQSASYVGPESKVRPFLSTPLFTL